MLASMSTPWRLDAGQIEVLDEAMVEVLRAKTPAERVAIGLDCQRTVRLRITSHLRTQYPDWSEAKIADETARRILRGAG